ncbi:26s proteasome regulatory subunit 6B [Orobanche minor]
MATATTMAVGPKPFPSEPPPTRKKTEYDLSSSVDADGDLYSRLKMLQCQHGFIEIQEEYVKDKLKNIRRELLRSQEEVKRIQSVPLHIRVCVQ